MCRLLTKDEIECRVSQTGKSSKGAWCSLLLYKDARVDQRILDETYGLMGWQRSHELVGDRLYCTVSVYDSDKKEWISKQDVGTESNTEKEKGQASDAFKRACFNWGIGRELYSAPKIYITLKEGEYRPNSDKIIPTVSFDVADIGYDDRGSINKLSIVDRNGEVRFSFGLKKKQEKKPEKKEQEKPKEQPKESNATLPVMQKGDEMFMKFVDWMTKHWGEDDTIAYGVGELRKKYTVSDEVLAAIKERAAFLSDLSDESNDI